MEPGIILTVIFFSSWLTLSRNVSYKTVEKESHYVPVCACVHCTIVFSLLLVPVLSFITDTTKRRKDTGPEYPSILRGNFRNAGVRFIVLILSSVLLYMGCLCVCA